MFIKKTNLLRLDELEKTIRYSNNAALFEEWLEANHPLIGDNCWSLLDLAPQEFQLECLSFILRKLQNNEELYTKKD